MPLPRHATSTKNLHLLMNLSSILNQVIQIYTPNCFYISYKYLEPSVFCGSGINFNNHSIKEEGGNDRGKSDIRDPNLSITRMSQGFSCD